MAETEPIIDLTKFVSQPGLPHYVTNDGWDDYVADALSLFEQEADTSTARGALICGPGGMPYLNGLLRAQHVVQIDREKTVLTFSEGRRDVLLSASSWKDCFSRMATLALRYDIPQSALNGERLMLRKVGMFDTT